MCLCIESKKTFIYLSKVIYDMRRNLFFLLFFALVLPLSVLSHSIVLKDASDNVHLGGVQVSFTLINSQSGEQKSFTTFLENGVFDYPFTEGEWFVSLRVMDNGRAMYYGEDSVVVTEDSVSPAALYLEKVGSVSGFVKDDLDNVVPDAELKFECAVCGEFDLPTKSDSFGSFRVDILPVGGYVVYASSEGYLGYSEITVTQGNLESVNIALEMKVKGKDKTFSLGYVLGVALIALLVAAGVMYYFLSSKNSVEKVKKPKKVKKGRCDDILPTLGTNEKEIVNFLMCNENKSTQASLRHNTGIPRTSLSRCLKSLERRNVVQIKARGKQRDVALTAWFLGKD